MVWADPKEYSRDQDTMCPGAPPGWSQIKTRHALSNAESVVYILSTTLTMRVPVCGQINPHSPNNTECRLPPGHESADIHCMSWSTPDPPGKFRTIVRVTSRDPRIKEHHDNDLV